MKKLIIALCLFGTPMVAQAKYYPNWNRYPPPSRGSTLETAPLVQYAEFRGQPRWEGRSTVIVPRYTPMRPRVGNWGYSSGYRPYAGCLRGFYWDGFTCQPF
jgi:hypothetical protein